MATVQDIVLAVPDVSCEHCVKTVNGALGTLPGVEAVSTDIPTKSVHVRYEVHRHFPCSTIRNLVRRKRRRVTCSINYHLK